MQVDTLVTKATCFNSSFLPPPSTKFVPYILPRMLDLYNKYISLQLDFTGEDTTS